MKNCEACGNVIPSAVLALCDRCYKRGLIWAAQEAARWRLAPGDTPIAAAEGGEWVRNEAPPKANAPPEPGCVSALPEPGCVSSLPSPMLKLSGEGNLIVEFIPPDRALLAEVKALLEKVKTDRVLFLPAAEVVPESPQDCVLQAKRLVHVVMARACDECNFGAVLVLDHLPTQAERERVERAAGRVERAAGGRSCVHSDVFACEVGGDLFVFKLDTGSAL
jgi:hypothetical protein